MNKKNQASWLQTLQINSWEPEILLSGIITFSLIQFPSYLDKLRVFITREIDVGQNADVIFTILEIGIYWQIIGFVIHLFFRGIWVSMIGLSYVFPEGINHSKISYKGKFQNRVDEIGSIESGIERLETLCSSIFSVSFLLFMSMIALALWFLSLFLLLTTFVVIAGYEWVRENGMLLNVIALVYIVMGLIYLIDFISLGILKKRKWTARLFFPIHWFMNLFTLTRQYRQIYYTFVTNIPKWKIISIFLIYISINLLLIFSWSAKVFLPYHNTFYTNTKLFLPSTAYHNNSDNYEDQKGLNNPSVTIQSEFIKTDVLRIFLVQKGNLDFTMRTECNLDGKGSLSNKEWAEQVKACINQHFSIYLDDSLRSEPNWLFFSQGEEKVKGYLCWLDIRGLNRGQHELNVYFNLGENSNLYESISFFKLNDSPE